LSGTAFQARRIHPIRTCLHSQLPAPSNGRSDQLSSAAPPLTSTHPALLAAPRATASASQIAPLRGNSERARRVIVPELTNPDSSCYLLSIQYAKLPARFG